MIEFWIAAAPLLLSAAACLLVPIWRGRQLEPKEDRAALNVSLYQERLAELTEQKATGLLSEAQWDAAKAEVARELLSDIDQAQKTLKLHLGWSVPVLAALSVPVVACVLYLSWGNQEKLALTQELSTEPKSLDEMVSRLERTVKVQPEAGQAWYVLGRTYMSQNKPAQAAPAFEKAISLLGRHPELLGAYIQARYFSAQGPRRWSDDLQALAEEALQADPKESTTLGLLGVAAFEDKRYQVAINFWQRLLSTLDEKDPARVAIEGGIARAKADLAQASSSSSIGDTGGGVQTLRLEVSLSPDVLAQVQPEDTVFVFVRAAQKDQPPMPMPLVAKKLTVAELPITLVLSDADAMLPQLRLSNFTQVRPMVKISRSGDAVSGDWITEGPIVAAGAADELIKLVVSPSDKSSTHN